VEVKKGVLTVINFSHPLDDEIKKQLESSWEGEIKEIIILSRIDMENIVSSLDKILEEVEEKLLEKPENILIIPPESSLVAWYISRIWGMYPTLVLKEDKSFPPKFILHEIISTYALEEENK
jgi:hypothetical protein